MNYGGFLYRQGRYNESCNMLLAAASDVMYAKRSDAFVNLGMCYLKLNKTQEAENSFKRSLQHNITNSSALLSLAKMKFDSGDFIDSQNYYDQFLKYGQQSPKSLWLGIRLAHIADNQDVKSSYILFLKNQFPESNEYKEYSDWSESHGR